MKSDFTDVGFSGFHVMAFDWLHFLGSHATLDSKLEMNVGRLEMIWTDLICGSLLTSG
jgi:hypothetical protein